VEITTNSHVASKEKIWNLLQEEIASFSNVGDIILTDDFNAYSPQAMNHMD